MPLILVTRSDLDNLGGSWEVILVARLSKLMRMIWLNELAFLASQLPI